MSTTSINESGRIIWVESFSSPDGVYGTDLDGSNQGIVTNRPVGASSWSNAVINDAGKLGYRAGIGFAGNALVIVEANGADDTIVAAEEGVDFQSPYSFIFTPDFNNNDQIAAKLRVGPGLSDSRPDEIRLFEIDGSSTLLAEDADANPMSIFEDFDNSVAINDQRARPPSSPTSSEADGASSAPTEAASPPSPQPTGPSSRTSSSSPRT